VHRAIASKQTPTPSVEIENGEADKQSESTESESGGSQKPSQRSKRRKSKHKKAVAASNVKQQREHSTEPRPIVPRKDEQSPPPAGVPTTLPPDPRLIDRAPVDSHDVNQFGRTNATFIDGMKEGANVVTTFDAWTTAGERRHAGKVELLRPGRVEEEEIARKSDLSGGQSERLLTPQYFGRNIGVKPVSTMGPSGLISEQDIEITSSSKRPPQKFGVIAPGPAGGARDSNTTNDFWDLYAQAQKKIVDQAAMKERLEAEEQRIQLELIREREEAERRAKEEAERRELEKVKRREKEEAERREQEEARRREMEEAERREREELERQRERQRREELEMLAKVEAERQAKEEAEKQERENAARRAKEEAERREREEAERKAKNEAKRLEREALLKKQQQEKERREKEEAERRAKEQEAKRLEREALLKQQQEEHEREQKEQREREQNEIKLQALAEALASKKVKEAELKAQERMAQTEADLQRRLQEMESTVQKRLAQAEEQALKRIAHLSQMQKVGALTKKRMPRHCYTIAELGALRAANTQFPSSFPAVLDANGHSIYATQTDLRIPLLSSRASFRNAPKFSPTHTDRRHKQSHSGAEFGAHRQGVNSDQKRTPRRRGGAAETGGGMGAGASSEKKASSAKHLSQKPSAPIATPASRPDLSSSPSANSKSSSRASSSSHGSGSTARRRKA